MIIPVGQEMGFFIQNYFEIVQKNQFTLLLPLNAFISFGNMFS